MLKLATGALSDRWGCKHLITAGMLLQSAALAIIATANSPTTWAAASVLLGAGTAMAYPTLLASIGDVAHPSWRARAVGVYRLWRDLGFAVGALLTGVLADAFGIHAAIWVIAALTAASGFVVALRMYESIKRWPTQTRVRSSKSARSRHQELVPTSAQGAGQGAGPLSRAT